jgi:hypothetical protein
METKQNEIRKMERKFAPFIKDVIQQNICRIPAEYSIVEESTQEEDTKLSFDLKFKTEMHVSIRLREFDALGYDDITIRSRSKNGNKTEIDKLYDGEGQLYFYGVMDEEQENIIQWLLYDINPIRFLLKKNGNIRKNMDGTEFRVYDFDFLKEHNCIVESYILEFNDDISERIKKYKITKQVKKNNKKYLL